MGGFTQALLEKMQEKQKSYQASFERQLKYYESVQSDPNATPEAKKAAIDGMQATQYALQHNKPKSMAQFYGTQLSELGSKLVKFGTGKGAKGKGKGGVEESQGQPQRPGFGQAPEQAPPQSAQAGHPAKGGGEEAPQTPQRPPRELPVKQGAVSKAFHGATRGLATVGGVGLKVAGGVLQGASRVANGPDSPAPPPMNPTAMQTYGPGEADAAKRSVTAKEIEENPSLSPEDKKAAQAKLYGVTEKPLMRAYKLSNGQIIWADANHPENLPAGATAVVSGAAGGKSVKGTLVRSKQSPTGFAQTWVDPTNPSKVTGWQPVTPSRFYQGSETSRTSTDNFGVTTTSSSQTKPMNSGNVTLGGQEMDLSNAPQVDGEPTEETPETPKAEKTKASAKPPRTLDTTPKPVKKPATATGGKFQVDAEGHIPLSANVNPSLRQAANQILDGADVDKLPIPTKDRAAAEALAEQYGWKGQGLFTPKDQLLLRESETYLKEALSNPSLKVLDSAASRIKIANMLSEHKGVISTTMMAAWKLNKDESEFMRMYNQLVGTVSGLAQLSRGGRTTEAGIHRLMKELPDPSQTHSSADGKSRIKRLLSEISVARQKGMIPDKDDRHKIEVNGKHYTYNGTGDTADMANYTEDK